MPGAALAGLLIAGLFGPEPVGAATPALGKDVSFTAGVVLETVTTFFLVVVVFGTAVDVRAPKGIYPFAIGLTVALDIMAIGPLTGAAINPARAFGPALASGHWHNHLVYWVGPLLGGAAAGLVQHFFQMEAAQSVPHPGGPTTREQRGEDHNRKMERVAAGQEVETPAGHKVSSVPAGRNPRVVGPT